MYYSLVTVEDGMTLKYSTYECVGGLLLERGPGLLDVIDSGIESVADYSSHGDRVYGCKTRLHCHTEPSYCIIKLRRHTAPSHCAVTLRRHTAPSPFGAKIQLDGDIYWYLVLVHGHGFAGR